MGSQQEGAVVNGVYAIAALSTRPLSSDPSVGGWRSEETALVCRVRPWRGG